VRVLFVDQSAQLGGAELSLIGHVTDAPFALTVLLFEDGPLATQLRRNGIATEVLSVGETAADIRRDSGWRRAIGAVPAVCALAWQVARRARAYDLVYANSQKAFVICALATALARVPLVWHLHDILTADHFGRFLRRFVVRLANARATWVIANSTATATAFIGLGGRADRVSVVYQGIDDAAFVAVAPATVAALRAQLGGETARLVGIFGRLAAWKGQAVFLRALALVPDVTGVIVGDALFGEQAYERQLHELTAELGLGERVKFLGFRDDVPALMRAMDVIVHSSIAAEPFGRVVVEAMLAGKPVIASAAGGILEILEDGRTGLLCEPGDVAGLAASLQRIISAPALAAALAQAGQAHARQYFTATASHAAVNEKLLALTARGNAGR
jgi:glycosyltransferase involved in cell wall biosynthesis